MKTHPPAHPTRLELGALSAGELAADRADEVREHLADCPECLEKISRMFSLPDSAPSPDFMVSAEELQRARQRIHAAAAEPPPPGPVKAIQLVSGDALARPLAEASPPKSSGRSFAFWLPGFGALAATALAGVALGFWLQPDSRDQIRPIARTGLSFASEGYRGGQPEGPIRLQCPPPGGNYAATITFPNGPLPKVVYYGIRTAAGEPIDEEAQAPLNRQHTVELEIPRSLLPNGRYIFLIRRDSKEAQREEIPFEANCPP